MRATLYRGSSFSVCRGCPTRGFLKIPSPITIQPVVHSVQRVIPFTSEQVFDVVADVDNYKQFLPFCQSSKVVRRISPTQFEADVTVGFGVFIGKYRSRVTLNRPQQITVKAIDSDLFEFLDSTWRFEDVRNARGDTGCKISFRINFKASSPIHAQALNFLFSEIAEQQLKAFEKRCHQLCVSTIGSKQRS
jgi:ribosome-associated toxin RatA of RatAB toxin-antitoxin module